MKLIVQKTVWFLVVTLFALPLLQIFFTEPVQASSLTPSWWNGRYQNNDIWDYTTDLSHANYGTHDWIADHAMHLLPSYERAWIQNHLNTFFLGTEAPDNASLDYLGANTGYGDFSRHVVTYGANGEVTNDASAKRAQEEYNKASAALPWDEDQAAYYAGAMTHYIADPAVYAHVMGGSSFLPDALRHSEFERGVASATLQYSAGTFEKYISAPGQISEATAYDSALAVARTTTFGYGATKPALWMSQNIPVTGNTWNINANATFTNSTGDSLYRAVVACAKVLHKLSMSKGYTVERIPQNGTTRYDTAVGISQKVFPTSKTASSIVLVSGNNPVDAIIAGPFAKQKNGVVLFSDTSALPAATLNEMQRVLPNSASSKVYIIGGTGSISSSIDSYLAGHFAYTVVRMGSSNRYQTSTDVASAMNMANSAFLTQTNAIDGIAAAGVGARDGRPILVTTQESLSTEVSNFLTNDPKGLVMNTVYVLGGTGAISSLVVDQLEALGKTVVRIAGATNRFDTARAIAEAFYSHPQKVIIANGYSMVDAVAGSVLAGRSAYPILLASSSALEETTQGYIDNNAATLQGGYVLGGTGAISYTTERIAGVHM